MPNYIVRNPYTGRTQYPRSGGRGGSGPSETRSAPTKFKGPGGTPLVDESKPYNKATNPSVAEQKQQQAQQQEQKAKQLQLEEQRKKEVVAQRQEQTQDLRQREVIKQQAIQNVAQAQVIESKYNPKTGMTRKVAVQTQSQVIRAGQLKNVPAGRFSSSQLEPTARDNLRKIDEAREAIKQEQIRQEKDAKFGLFQEPDWFSERTKQKYVQPVQKYVQPVVVQGKQLLQKAYSGFINQKGTPLFNIYEKYPRASKYVLGAVAGAGAFALTRNYHLARTTFKADRVLFPLFAGQAVKGYQEAPNKIEYVAKTGAEFATFYAGGAITSRAGKVSRAVKAYSSAKLEQAQLNLALEVEGGKLVTKNFYKKPNLKSVTVEGEALVSAKGVTTEFQDPLISERVSQYTPKTKKVKVTFDPRKPPVPDDFLVVGVGTEKEILYGKQTVKNLPSPSTVSPKRQLQPVSSPRLARESESVVTERVFPIKGYGFGGEVERASLPYKAIEVSEGLGLPLGRTRVKTIEVELQFQQTKLARGQSVTPYRKSGRRYETSPKEYKTRIGLAKRPVEYKQPPINKGGTLILREDGATLFAPKRVKLTEGAGKIGGFYEVQRKPTTKGLTSKQILQQFPVLAKKVKLTPKKVPKVTEGIEVEIPVKAGSSYLVQKLILASPNLQQKQKQATKQQQKAKQKQKVVQGLKQKQATKQQQKAKQKQKVVQGLKQKQAQSLKVATGIKSALKVGQVVKQRQKVKQAAKQRSKLRLAQVPKLKQNVKLDTSLKVDLTQKVAQKIKPELTAVPELKPPPPNLKIPPEDPPPPPPPRFYPLLRKPKNGSRRRSKRSERPSRSRQTSYTPTLVGLSLPKIKGTKKLATQQFSGLGVRPQVKLKPRNKKKKRKRLRDVF